MPSPRKQRSNYNHSVAEPPSYRSEQSYGRDGNEEDEEEIRRPISRAPINTMTGPVDSSRAIANGGERQQAYDESNGAGVGAGRNAYLLDTPSMYTDPFEYNSTVVGGSKGAGGANVLSTRPDANFLSYDPYHGEERSRTDLNRSNTIGTLGPGDSISSYNVNAISRNIGQVDDEVDPNFNHKDRKLHQSATYVQDEYNYGGGQHNGDQTVDYYEAPYGGHGTYDPTGDEIPLKGYPAGMGYAEDEDEEMKQREAYWNEYSRDNYDQKHPPSLFANKLQGPPPPMQRKSVDESGEDRKGLLRALPWGSKEGAIAGWGGTLEDQIQRRRRGVGRQRWPILTWILSVAYIAVFIVELIKSKAETGQAIQTSPSWNPMLGPPFEFLISFGARFVPCMRNVPDIPTSTELACLKYSTLSSLTTDQQCPIWQLCGLPNASTTNQAYRFVTPIFLHAGFIHIGFNLLVQLTLCAQIEKLISTPFYAIIYFAGGIGGNLLGGNFGLVGQPSVGASGAIYTCISLELVDLCYNWKFEYRPRMRLFVSIVFAIIGFAIGLLPGLDNFAHIGGFAVGTLGGLLFCPSIHETRRHRVITWILRIVAAGLLVGFFVGLGTNFYSSEDPNKACTWCHYLSCLPTFSQCKGNGLTSTSTSSSGTSTSANF